MQVTLHEAKQYLRVDTEDDDSLIENLIYTAEKYCKDILRLDASASLPNSPEMVVAILYALAFLYENRESCSHNEMMCNLRILLAGGRKEVF